MEWEKGAPRLSQFPIQDAFEEPIWYKMRWSRTGNARRDAVPDTPLPAISGQEKIYSNRNCGTILPPTAYISCGRCEACASWKYLRTVRSEVLLVTSLFQRGRHSTLVDVSKAGLISTPGETEEHLMVRAIWCLARKPNRIETWSRWWILERSITTFDVDDSIGCTRREGPMLWQDVILVTISALTVLPSALNFASYCDLRSWTGVCSIVTCSRQI
jgi:hypothetical protein